MNPFFFLQLSGSHRLSLSLSLSLNLAFPLQMYVLTFVLRVLPPGVVDLTLSALGLQSKQVDSGRIG